MTTLKLVNPDEPRAGGAFADILARLLDAQGAVQLAADVILREAPEDDELMRAENVLCLVARDLAHIHGEVDRIALAATPD